MAASAGERLAGTGVTRGSRLHAYRLLAYVLLAVHFGVIVWIWAGSSLGLLSEGTPNALISLGQLAGLLAAGCALLQFMLMGRAGWLEQSFGLERLAKVHRFNGFATISFILVHPLLLAMGYAALAEVSLITQEITFLTKFEDVWQAAIAAVLFIAVVVSSIWIVRKHLPYERWYWVHLMVYAAILLAFGHQTKVGGSFLAQPVFVTYWYALYIFVGLNVLIGRFLMPAYKYWRHRFVIESVVRETADTVSINISGRQLNKFRAYPGQFIIIWLPIKGFWAEEHPFSLSALPNGEHLRITPKAVGDYTSKLPNLTPGTRVVVSGPYGRFTPPETATRKRLYIAGGVGITPLRAMIEAQAPGLDTVLIYGNKTSADIIFQSELADFSIAKQLRVFHVLSNEPGAQESGYIDVARIARLVPDFKDRDVYLCGPPVMMYGLTPALIAAGLPTAQLHSERFALHPVS